MECKIHVAAQLFLVYTCHPCPHPYLCSPMVFQDTIVPLLVPSILERIVRVLMTRAFLDGDVTIDALTNW